MRYLKAIPNFPNYCITKDGKVWSKPKSGTGWSKNGRWLKPGNDTDGYLQINLFNDEKRFTRKIHRLILETYVGPCPIGMECRHLDGNCQNNFLSNLKWGTGSENSYDAVRHGTAPGFINKGEGHGMAKLTEKDVRMIIYMWKTKLFTQREIAEQYNISNGTVSNVITKQTWKHIWVA